MFWIVNCLIWWGVWLIFADKSRWREIVPVSIFASWISLFAEAIVRHDSELWCYSGDPLRSLFSHALGIYVVVPYLFIQWLPSNRTLKRTAFYFFLWTGFAVSNEWVYLYFGQMKHCSWWTLGHSYLADWILLGLFLLYYDVTRLRSRAKG